MQVQEESKGHSPQSLVTSLIRCHLTSINLCLSSYGWVTVVKFGQQIQHYESSPLSINLRVEVVLTLRRHVV